MSFFKPVQQRRDRNPSFSNGSVVFNYWVPPVPLLMTHEHKAAPSRGRLGWLPCQLGCAPPPATVWGFGRFYFWGFGVPLFSSHPVLTFWESLDLLICDYFVCVFLNDLLTKPPLTVVVVIGWRGDLFKQFLNNV